jgi:ribosomal protein S18 acetylase RimI-like enzyme
MSPSIINYDDVRHREHVIALWRDVFGYPAAYNDPAFVIDRKRAVDDLFWVAEEGGTVSGTVMAGYDGHRGWIYALAVAPDQRGLGLGTRLLEHALSALKKKVAPRSISKFSNPMRRCAVFTRPTASPSSPA